ncbi:bleomycin resistance protein [Enterobacter sp. MGH 24]|nr:bleomycin resistance protein [Enterobacter sp. MGH 24]
MQSNQALSFVTAEKNRVQATFRSVFFRQMKNRRLCIWRLWPTRASRSMRFTMPPCAPADTITARRGCGHTVKITMPLLSSRLMVITSRRCAMRRKVRSSALLSEAIKGLRLGNGTYCTLRPNFDHANAVGTQPKRFMATLACTHVSGFCSDKFVVFYRTTRREQEIT